MGFLICSYFVAHISETCLLFTLFLMIRLSARDKHLPRSFKQQCQDKSAGRTPFKSTIRTINEASECLFLAPIVALATALFYAIKPALTCARTSRIYAEQSCTPVLHEAKSLMTQSKDERHIGAELLRLTPILTLAYEEFGTKEMKTFYSIGNPIVCCGHGFFEVV